MSFTGRRASAQSQRDVYARIARRSARLMLLGFMLNMVASAPHVIGMRIPDVLQRIGLVYVIAAPLMITLSAGWRSVALAALVVGHWALLMIPISGYETFTTTHNVSRLVHRAILPATSSRRREIHRATEDNSCGRHSTDRLDRRHVAFANSMGS